MPCLGNLLLLGSAAAFLLTCGLGFAQLPSAAERWPDSWIDKARELLPTTAKGEPDHEYGSHWGVRQQPPISGIVTLQELSHHPPRRAEREFKRATTAQFDGNLQAAIRHYQKAIAIDPEFCAALNDLGADYLETHQLDLAVEQFKKAIVVDPHRAKPYSNLAIAYIGKGRYADAEHAARRAVDNDRTGTHGQLALGVSLVLQEKSTAETERSLKRAAPDFPDANFWLALNLLNRGEIETAKEQLRLYLARGEKASSEVARSYTATGAKRPQ